MHQTFFVISFKAAALEIFPDWPWTSEVSACPVGNTWILTKSMCDVLWLTPLIN